MTNKEEVLDVKSGLRVMTGSGPGTVIRVFVGLEGNEIHVRADKYPDMTMVYRPEDIVPVTSEDEPDE